MKDRKHFDKLFNELFKEGINQMLKAEMTDHLGYEEYGRKMPMLSDPGKTTGKTYLNSLIIPWK